MPTRRPDKYTEVTEDTEHARTISRNIDDFLEVERGGNKVAVGYVLKGQRNKQRKNVSEGGKRIFRMVIQLDGTNNKSETPSKTL